MRLHQTFTSDACKGHNDRMNLGLRELATFLAEHKNDQSLVLAVVTATEGSTYRKPGGMMLIRKNGEFAGLISGGCLEGDLVEQASNDDVDASESTPST